MAESNNILQDLIENIENGVKIKSVLLDTPSINTKKNLKTLINAAIEAESEGTIRILVALGANINDVLQTAIKTKSQNIVNFSLENGANAKAFLDFAITGGCEGILFALLQNGADVNEALYYSVIANDTKTITFLLDQGADINTNQRGGNTPLHVAVIRKSDSDLVNFLIEKGADCNMRNKSNKTALDLVQAYIEGNNNSVKKNKFEGTKTILLTKTNESGYDSLQGLPNTYCGILYQIKLLTLVAVRVMGSEFQLATEIVDAHPFDDIFLSTTKDGQNECLFLQVKHTNKPAQNKISESELFTMFNSPFTLNSTKGDFALIKYLINFYKITKGPLCKGATLKIFAICTNTFFFDNAITYFRCKDILEEDILYFNSGVSKKCKIHDCYHTYLFLEVKYVLLNALNENGIEILDETQKVNISKQIELVKQIVKRVKDKTLIVKLDAECETLWNIKKIIKKGSNTIKSNLKYLTQSKQKLSKERQLSNIPDVLNNIKKKMISIDETIKRLKTTEELYANVENWNDDIVNECIKTFIKQFSIIIGSPDINTVDTIINQEVNIKMDMHNSSFVTDRIEKMVSNWFTSSRNCRANFFTNSNIVKINTHIKDLVYTQMLNGVCKSYIDQLRQNNIHFEGHHEELEKFLTDDKQILHLVSENTLLCAIRALQAIETVAKVKNNLIDTFIFININNGYISSKTLNNLLYVFASNVSHRLLVLECSGESQEFENFYELFDELRNILKENVLKKVIVIANKENKLAIELKHVFKQRVTSFCDVITFRNLSKPTQESILDKTVWFQSKENQLKLRDIIDDISARDIVDEGVLAMIIKKQEYITIGRADAFYSDEYNPEYYVQRSIHHQVIDIDFFKSIHNKLVFLTGIARRDLAEKLDFHDKKLIYDWNENKYFNNGILLVPNNTYSSHEEIFQKISKNTTNNVVWLDYNNGLFFWKGVKAVDGNGHIYANTRNIDLTEEHSTPDALEQRVVIVANHPGEGKSTMLTDLAHTIRKKYSHLWIVRINLNEYAINDKACITLKNIEFRENQTLESIQFLTKMVIKGESKDPKIRLQRKIFEGALKEDAKIKVILMFDGFDEISPGYKHKTCIMIKALKESKAKQMFVTTRDHLKTYLEEQLQSPACMLTPLNEVQQIDFLNRFWKCHLKFQGHISENQSENIIATIFLRLEQCREQIKLQSSNMTSDDSNLQIIIELSNQLEKIQTVPNNCKIKVLNEYIDTRLHFKGYAKMLLAVWNASVHDGNKSFLNVPLNLRMLAENIFKRNLQIPKNIGVFEIYGQFIQDKLKIYQQKKSNFESGNEANKDQAKLVLQIIRNIHRELAVKKLFHPSCNLPNFDTICTYNITDEELTRIGLIKTQGMYFEFVHRSYAEYLFSEYLFLNLNNSEVQREFLVKVLVDSSYSLIRHFFNAFLFLSEQKNENCRPDYWPLLKKVGSSFVSDNKLISACISPEMFYELITQRDYYKVNALSIAASEGHTAIFQLIWDKTKDINNVIPHNLLTHEDYCGRTVFHRAIMNGHTDMMLLILGIANDNTTTLKDMLTKCDEDGENSLHLSVRKKNRHHFKVIFDTAKYHPEIISDLVTQCDHDGRTILHLATNASSEDICELILEIIKDYPDVLKKVLLQCDHDGQTVLHVATMKGEQGICKNILESLKKYSDALETLLTQYDQDGQTALHIACVKNNKEICKSILESTKEYTECAISLITQCGKDGHTPLCIAELHDFKDIYNVILETAETYPNCLNKLVSVVLPDRQQSLFNSFSAMGFWKIHKFVKIIVRRYPYFLNEDVMRNKLACQKQLSMLLAYKELIDFIQDALKKHPKVTEDQLIDIRKYYPYVEISIAQKHHNFASEAYKELYIELENNPVVFEINLTTDENEIKEKLIKAHLFYNGICNLILLGPEEIVRKLADKRKEVLRKTNWRSERRDSEGHSSVHGHSFMVQQPLGPPFDVSRPSLRDFYLNY